MHASTSTMVGCELLLARDDLGSLLLRHEPVWQLLLQDKRHRRRRQVWSRRRIQLLLLQIGAIAAMEKRGLSEKSGWSRCGASPFAVRRSQRRGDEDGRRRWRLPVRQPRRKQGVVVVRAGDPGMGGTSAGCRRAEPWRRWWEARRSSPGGNEEELVKRGDHSRCFFIQPCTAARQNRKTNRTGTSTTKQGGERTPPATGDTGGESERRAASFSGSDSAAVSGTQSEFSSSYVRHK
jgi:hypothetical protein